MHRLRLNFPKAIERLTSASRPDSGVQRAFLPRGASGSSHRGLQSAFVYFDRPAASRGHGRTARASGFRSELPDASAFMEALNKALPEGIGRFLLWRAAALQAHHACRL
jgi:hypothetical protein